jgi:serine/threonine-protein kinase
MEASLLTRRCEACGYRYESGIDVCPVDGRAVQAGGAGVADLGSYRLIERLGDGGMGAVYRAVHRKLERAVAIKVLRKNLTSDRGIINRFFHEARAANTIRHEHVIEVYDFVEDGDNVYFVMELLRGRDLHDIIHSAGGGPIEPVRAAAILEQIASALHATHARDIIHRDLKPENVFLCEKDGQRDFVKVIDYGIAKLDRPDGRATVTGAVLGTPEYIAPEQARGLQIDGRADIYSLGCVAYEMLTRHQLFGGGTASEILIRQITMAPPPIRRFAPHVPEGLEAAIMKALAKNPADRPQTARLFAEELARAMERTLEDSSAFHSGGLLRSGSGLGAAPAPTPTPGLVLRAPTGAGRRGLWRPIALGTVTATLLTGAVVTATLRRPSSTPRAANPRPPVTATAPIAAPAPPPPRPAPPAPANVMLESIPSGAEIVDEQGATIGVTPQSVPVAVGMERAVTFRKAGFHDLERRFRPAGNMTVTVDLDPEAPARPARRGAGKGQRQAPTTLDSAAGTIDPFHE